MSLLIFLAFIGSYISLALHLRSSSNTFRRRVQKELSSALIGDQDSTVERIQAGNKDILHVSLEFRVVLDLVDLDHSQFGAGLGVERRQVAAVLPQAALLPPGQCFVTNAADRHRRDSLGSDTLGLQRRGRRSNGSFLIGRTSEACQQKECPGQQRRRQLPRPHSALTLRDSTSTLYLRPFSSVMSNAFLVFDFVIVLMKMSWTSVSSFSSY